MKVIVNDLRDSSRQNIEIIAIKKMRMRRVTSSFFFDSIYPNLGEKLFFMIFHCKKTQGAFASLNIQRKERPGAKNAKL